MPESAGYDRDALECAARIAEPGKRVLLVHGLTAEDRRTFVESRLAPFLEARDRMFGFVRSADGSIEWASHDPATEIDTSLRAVGAGTTRIGLVQRRLFPETNASGDHEQGTLIPADTGAGPFEALAALTRVSPDTIVVAVFEPTVPAMPDTDDPFVSLLRKLGETQIDAKVVVTLDSAARVRMNEALSAGGPHAAYAVPYRVR